MNEETRNRLTAWFDGELPDDSGIEALLEKDADARAYVNELRQMRKALDGAHAEARTPAPDWETFSSRLDEQPASSDGARVLSFPRALAAVAAVMILGMAIWIPFRQASINTRASDSEWVVNSVEMVETDIENATPVVYLDQPSGWTVVWVLDDSEPTGI